MPRLLALGHVSRDRRPGGDVLGGSVTYGALAARKLGWEAAILTSAGPDFEPERELPGIPAFVRRSSATTRFVNEYDADGTRHQVVTARAEDVDLEALPAAWRNPDALLLGPLVGELSGVGATALEAGCVGAIAQGYVRAIDGDGLVSAREWARPERDLLGVHVLFLSEHDLPDALARARDLLALVPMIALTRGWRGLTLLTRQEAHEVPSLPRPEVDPTGAGDVFAAAFLVRYQETGDPLAAAAFGAAALVPKKFGKVSASLAESETKKVVLPPSAAAITGCWRISGVARRLPSASKTIVAGPGEVKLSGMYGRNTLYAATPWPSRDELCPKETGYW
jgi:sugar/nucleoside kinase (ribokinase family)